MAHVPNRFAEWGKATLAGDDRPDRARRAAARPISALAARDRRPRVAGVGSASCSRSRSGDRVRPGPGRHDSALDRLFTTAYPDGFVLSVSHPDPGATVYQLTSPRRRGRAVDPGATAGRRHRRRYHRRVGRRSSRRSTTTRKRPPDADSDPPEQRREPSGATAVVNSGAGPPDQPGRTRRSRGRLLLQLPGRLGRAAPMCSHETARRSRGSRWTPIQRSRRRRRRRSPRSSLTGAVDGRRRLLLAAFERRCGHVIGRRDRCVAPGDARAGLGLELGRSARRPQPRENRWMELRPSYPITTARLRLRPLTDRGHRRAAGLPRTRGHLSLPAVRADGRAGLEDKAGRRPGPAGDAPPRGRA